MQWGELHKEAYAMAVEPGSKSLVDEIVDTWFERLESAEEFDASTVGRLRELIPTKGLTRPADVIDVIKMGAEVQDESPRA